MTFKHQLVRCEERVLRRQEDRKCGTEKNANEKGLQVTHPNSIMIFTQHKIRY